MGSLERTGEGIEDRRFGNVADPGIWERMDSGKPFYEDYWRFIQRNGDLRSREHRVFKPDWEFGPDELESTAMIELWRLLLRHPVPRQLRELMLFRPVLQASFRERRT
jgi:hypothetical protein